MSQLKRCQSTIYMSNSTLCSVRFCDISWELTKVATQKVFFLKLCCHVLCINCHFYSGANENLSSFQLLKIYQKLVSCVMEKCHWHMNDWCLKKENWNILLIHVEMNIHKITNIAVKVFWLKLQQHTNQIDVAKRYRSLNLHISPDNMITVSQIKTIYSYTTRWRPNRWRLEVERVVEELIRQHIVVSSPSTRTKALKNKPPLPGQKRLQIFS